MNENRKMMNDVYLNTDGTVLSSSGSDSLEPNISVNVLEVAS
jgi:hypothetical protein